MLAVVQFPIADARRFATGEASRLPLPDWPPRTHEPPQFVRGFGPGVERKRGADVASVEELTFCRAARAVRFDDLRHQRLEVNRNVAPVCASRRLLYDGIAVARVEISVASDRKRQRLEGVSLAKAVEIARGVLLLRTAVGPNGPKPRPLILQGRPLAKLYSAATTRRAGTSAGATPRLVEDGRPALLLQFEKGELAQDALGEPVKVVDPNKVCGAAVAFTWMKTEWGPYPTWLIAPGTAHAGDLRSLRLCLLRLHAEQEVLDLVIKRIDSGAITHVRGSVEGKALELYLNAATRFINRESWAGLSQSALTGAMDAAQSVHAAAGRQLVQRLAGVRLQVLRKVTAYDDMRGESRDVQIVSSNGSHIEVHQTQIFNNGNFSNATINQTAAKQIEDAFRVVPPPA